MPYLRIRDVSVGRSVGALVAAPTDRGPQLALQLPPAAKHRGLGLNGPRELITTSGLQAPISIQYTLCSPARAGCHRELITETWPSQNNVEVAPHLALGLGHLELLPEPVLVAGEQAIGLAQPRQGDLLAHRQGVCMQFVLMFGYIHIRTTVLFCLLFFSLVCSSRSQAKYHGD